MRGICRSRKKSMQRTRVSRATRTASTWAIRCSRRSTTSQSCFAAEFISDIRDRLTQPTQLIGLHTSILILIFTHLVLQVFFVSASLKHTCSSISFSFRRLRAHFNLVLFYVAKVYFNFVRNFFDQNYEYKYYTSSFNQIFEAVHLYNSGRGWRHQS